MPDYRLAGLEATRCCAASCARQLRVEDVLLLRGGLGAGKTTFVRFLVGALGGLPAQVASPTFALVHEYQADPPVVHVDAYRLGDAEELLETGFEERRAGAIACIEWPERIAGLLDERDCWRLAFEHLDERTRSLELRPPDGRSFEDDHDLRAGA